MIFVWGSKHFVGHWSRGYHSLNRSQPHNQTGLAKKEVLIGIIKKIHLEESQHLAQNWSHPGNPVPRMAC